MEDAHIILNEFGSFFNVFLPSELFFSGFVSSYEFRFMTFSCDFYVFIETGVAWVPCSGFMVHFDMVHTLRQKCYAISPLILKFVQTAFAQLCSHNENAYPASFWLPPSLQRSVHHRGLCPFVHGGMPFISVFPEARRPSSMCTWIAATNIQSNNLRKLKSGAHLSLLRLSLWEILEGSWPRLYSLVRYPHSGGWTREG